MKLLVALGLVSMSSVAAANCWMECVVPNPWGGCIREIKVCDIENPGRAAASLDNDLKKATDGLIYNWHNAYGQVPSQYREVLNRYPLTIACTLYPETRGIALAIGALEGLVNTARDRNERSKPVVQGAPDWKRNLVYDGEAYLLTQEVLDLKTTDWNAPTAQAWRDRFHDIHGRFLTCVQHAPNLDPEGKRCLSRLKRDALDRMEGLI